MTATLVTVVHIFICVFLILIVLLQQGKGADVGATFGGGGNTMFGATGADNFLTKVTTFVAICFMLTSVVLAVHGQGGGNSQGTVLESLPDASPSAPDAVTAPSGAETAEPSADAPAASEKAAENAAEAPQAAAPATKETSSPEAPAAEAAAASSEAPAAAAAPEQAAPATPPAEAEAPKAEAGTSQ